MSTNAIFLRTLVILLIAFDSYGDPSAGPFGQITTGSITNNLSPGGLIRKDGDQAPNQIQGVTNIIDDIKKALRFIPGDTSKAVETYLSIVRPKEIQDDGAMAGANEGIISYFQDVYSAPTPESLCLNMKARLFYASLHEKSKLEGIPTEGPLGRRPSLATRIEQTSDSAGWVWEKAMQLSANDPNEAMSLIGLCGHDDVGAERAILSKPIRERKIAHFSPRIQGILQKHRYFECPKQDSRFYYPGSLGKEADISTQLKNKIGLVQAPILGQSAIPSTICICIQTNSIVRQRVSIKRARESANFSI